MQNSSVEEVGLDYWLKWQVPVCGLIILIPALVVIKLIKSRTRNQEELQNLNELLLWVPCWRKLNPKWLLFYRAFAFLSMAYLLYQMLLAAGLFSFLFYTQWTFALVMLYFGLGTFISARGCFMSSSKSSTRNTEKQKSVEKESDAGVYDKSHQGSGVLGSLMLIIYQTSAGASVLTDLVFWCILVPMMAGKQFELTLVIGCIHSLNAVFLVIDALFNAIPFQWFGFTYFILWSIIYVTFQWILHACGSKWWPYPFLELSTPLAPLWYLGLALIHVPCYGVYYLFVRLKNSILSKLFDRAFVRSHELILQHQKAA